ncbi:MAG TPA: arginine--tRNA ligase, partial [Chryseosolibacter sp.]|nr:arginine--tRNA ligase [Chryseosolibacter sp.]
MGIEDQLKKEIQLALVSLFQLHTDQLQIQPTNQEFAGSHTLVCFPLTRAIKKKPEDIGRAIGEFLLQNSSVV